MWPMGSTSSGRTRVARRVASAGVSGSSTRLRSKVCSAANQAAISAGHAGRATVVAEEHPVGMHDRHQLTAHPAHPRPRRRRMTA